MNTQVLSRRRNLGIIAHIDAGKTTLTERLLWKSGEIHRVGEVHDGNATTDFSAIERERGITIGAAAVQAQWAPRDLPPHRLTLIDTPGTLDAWRAPQQERRKLMNDQNYFLMSLKAMVDLAHERFESRQGRTLTSVVDQGL